MRKRMRKKMRKKIRKTLVDYIFLGFFPLYLANHYIFAPMYCAYLVNFGMFFLTLYIFFLALYNFSLVLFFDLHFDHTRPNAR